MSSVDQQIRITPLTAAIGADVDGVDLSAPLDAATVARLRQALLDHLVLFFHDQHLSPHAQLRFCEYFGPVLSSTGERPGDEVPGVSVLDQVNPRGQGSDEWHSDHMFTAEPPLGTVLSAVRLPEVGGDTCFASMYAAYDALSTPMKALLDGLTAVNSPAGVVARVGQLGIYRNDIADGGPPSAVHPVVRVHPETGRKSLYVSARDTVRIVELEERESDAVLAFLREHLASPMFQCRLRWRLGSVAFWDNRAAQHIAVTDYHERRVMHRTMIGGVGR